VALASEIPLASFGNHSADPLGDGLLRQQVLKEAGFVAPSIPPGSMVVVAEEDFLCSARSPQHGPQHAVRYSLG
jgi:hypothetical protein